MGVGFFEGGRRCYRSLTDPESLGRLLWVRVVSAERQQPLLENQQV